MRILLTNDDGIEAPGIRALAKALIPEHDVCIVAPETEKSATAHAITVAREIRLTPHPELVPSGEAWAFDANPADCTKMALSMLLADNPPDLVISGINRGQNTGTNVIYSGTVAGAAEAALFGKPAFAISLGALPWDEPIFTHAAEIARQLAPQIAAMTLPADTILSINVPNLPAEELKPLRWATQGTFRFHDHYEIQPIDQRAPLPEGAHYLRNVGDRIERSVDPNADDRLLAEGHPTITPLTCDRTHHEFLSDPPEVNLSL